MNRVMLQNVSPPLEALGELLARQGFHFGLVLAGGAALNLLGLIRRPTNDVDLLAMTPGRPSSKIKVMQPPSPLPDALAQAIQQVATDFRLTGDWLNNDVAIYWETGLPPEWIERIHWKEFIGLSIGLVDRHDLIFLKLYAAVDRAAIEADFYQPSKHEIDLIALAPTNKELAIAQQWVFTQRAAPEYVQHVNNVIRYVRKKLN